MAEPEPVGDPVRERARRAWPLVVVALAVVMVLLAAGWWYLWVPTWRPPRRAGELYGIDVSTHQARIEWPRVVADDIQFAYIKASEGGDFVDARFAENWKGAGESGLRRGAYHFFTLCTPGPVQAANFLRVAPPDPGALAPAVDLEIAGNCSRRPPREEVGANIDGFLRLVEEAWGREVVIYVDDPFDGRYPVRARLARPLWTRRFLLRPAGPWRVWQLHGYAEVAGVRGGVDLNVLRAEGEG